MTSETGKAQREGHVGVAGVGGVGASGAAVVPAAGRATALEDSYRGRRLFYGLNVGVVLLLAVCVVVGVNFLAHSMELGRSDWTRTSVNSLSERSMQVLRDLDQPVRATVLADFTPGSDSEQDKAVQTELNRLESLLKRYQSENPARFSYEIVNRRTETGRLELLNTRLIGLRNEQAKQARPVGTRSLSFEEAAREFAEWAGRVLAFCLEEAAAFEELIERNQQSLGRNRGELSDIAMAPTMYRIRAQEFQASLRSMQQQQDLVDLESVLKAAAGAYSQFQEISTLQRWYEQLAGLRGLAEADANWLRGFAGRTAPLVSGLANRVNEIEQLGRLPIEETRSELLRPDTISVLLEQQEQRRVLRSSELWSLPPGMSLAELQRDVRVDFSGESAITSAIIRFNHPEGTEVVFVRFGGPPAVWPYGRLPGAPDSLLNRGSDRDMVYSRLRDRLEREGYRIGPEWDLRFATEPPPTAQNAPRRVYVVLPHYTQDNRSKPESMTEQGPMNERDAGERITPEQIQHLARVLTAETRVLFIAGWGYPPLDPFIQTQLPYTYLYGPLIERLSGIVVHTGGIVIRREPSPRRQDGGRLILGPGAPLLGPGDLLRTAHPINRGLGSIPSAVVFSSWLTRSENAPANSTFEPILTTSEDSRIFGAADFEALAAGHRSDPFAEVLPGARDVAAPLVLAAAATVGGEGGARVVVVASQRFAIDGIAAVDLLPQVSPGMWDQITPGNIATTVNAIHWLDGSARSSIPPTAGQLARVDLGSGSSELLRGAVQFGWPALFALGGITVLLLRRR